MSSNPSGLWKETEERFLTPCGKSFTELVASGEILFKESTEPHVLKELQLIKRFIDELHSLIVSQLAIRLHFLGCHNDDKRTAQLATLHKGCLSLFVATSLTEQGLYGPARPSLRYTFESTLVAKYASIDPSGKVLSKWIANKPIYLAKDVLAHIEQPTSSLQEVWGNLCETTHFTTCSQQIFIGCDDSDANTKANLAIGSMLCAFLYHLYTTHYNPPMSTYHLEFFGIANKTKESKRKIREILQYQRLFLHPNVKRAIAVYKRSWTII